LSTIGEEQMRKLLTLLLLSGAAFAAQTCPVTIVKFFPREGPNGIQAYIQWESTSDKVTGARFGAYYISLGEKHEFFQMLSYDMPRGGKPLKSGRKHYNTWDVFQDRTDKGGAWVDKVSFSDGTSWQDDGTRSCSFTK
jgi:hypothetical protein